MSAPVLNTLLLVDDDATLRERLARALRERGYEVATAGGAYAAYELAQATPPDAIVLDLKMPDISGIEALRELLQIAPKARVLMVTGYGSIATALEAVRMGAWDYMTKPVDADQIVAALLRDPHAVEAKDAPVEQDPHSLEWMEWEHIQRVLTECDGNISKAAQVLGLHRRSLQRKLQKYPPQR